MACSSSSSSAVRPRSCSAGRPRSRSPARLARRSRCSPSKAKTATSISSMTFCRRAVASRAPSRWERRVSARAFTSTMACPSASSTRGARARKLKSSSRNAASRFERVCRGRTTAFWTAKAKPSHSRTTSRVSVHWVRGAKSPVKSRRTEREAPGRPASRARPRTRCSWLKGGRARRLVNKGRLPTRVRDDSGCWQRSGCWDLASRWPASSPRVLKGLESGVGATEVCERLGSSRATEGMRVTERHRASNRSGARTTRAPHPARTQ